MKPNVIALALLGLGLFFVFKKQDHPVVPDTPDNVAPAPSVEMQNLVAPLKQFRGKKNAGVAAKFYADFADVLQRDSGKVTTTGQFRNAHVNAQTLAFARTDVAGSLPGVSALIDSVLSAALSKDDAPLNRTKTVEVLNAIAWGLGGK